MNEMLDKCETLEAISYGQVLVCAGANVLAIQTFGSWQGDWWALVEYEGRRGWVRGCFGSSDETDALMAEFGYGEIEDAERRFAEFGKEYLDDMMTQAEAVAEASRFSRWDVEADPMVVWIRKTGQQYGVE